MTRAEAKRRWIVIGIAVAIGTGLTIAVILIPALAERWPLAGLVFAQLTAHLALDRWASR